MVSRSQIVIPSRRRWTSPSLISTLPFLPMPNRQSLDRAARVDGVPLRLKQRSRTTPSWQIYRELSQRLTDPNPSLRPPVADVAKLCLQEMQWEQLWTLQVDSL